MSDKKPKRVVIAGGGTAGWCAAAAISSQLGHLVDVTLVESDDIGTIGVGEATIPTFRTFHYLLGIDERAFMRAAKATFKLGIAFENWGDIGDRYIHSFGQIGKSNWMGDFHQIWMAAQEKGIGGDLDAYCFELQAADACKFATSDKATINYAYHLDAGLYARFLRKFSEAKGATRIEGKIASVEQNSENGFITSVTLESGNQIEGDLFVDCTGFRGLLIDKTLGSKFVDWSHWLPTNTALAAQTNAHEDAVPYTRAVAHKAGWRWRIPLQHRVGNGLVFCSDHMEEGEAQDLFLQELGEEPITDIRTIRYKTGARAKTWVKNCVALGLSSGFVEPLESTSIHLMMIGVTRLIQHFPFGEQNQPLIDRYNDLCERELEQVRDFIILHYNATQRNDSEFWRYCNSLDIPDTLAARIALFKENAYAYQAEDELFRVDSWIQVMRGQRIKPRGYHRMGHLMTEDQMKRALGGLQKNIANAVASMPTHQAFLDQYCGAPSA